MTKPEISGIAPLFIVNNVPAALAFYRDRLGFDITLTLMATFCFSAVLVHDCRACSNDRQ